jgi:hypothetical protein
MARYCCSTSFPCDCGGRFSKSRVRCESCQAAKDKAEWFEKPAVEWDGKFPIAIWNSERFFWCGTELQDWIEEQDEETLGLNPKLDDSIWLTSCKPNNGRDFEMSDFLSDELHEDSTLDDSEINKTVNDWIAKNAPFSWSMTGDRLCIESVKKYLVVR